MILAARHTPVFGRVGVNRNMSEGRKMNKIMEVANVTSFFDLHPAPAHGYPLDYLVGNNAV